MIEKKEAYWYDGKPYASKEDAQDRRLEGECDNEISGGRIQRYYIPQVVRKNLKLIKEIYFSDLEK